MNLDATTIEDLENLQLAIQSPAPRVAVIDSIGSLDETLADLQKLANEAASNTLQSQNQAHFERAMSHLDEKRYESAMAELIKIKPTKIDSTTDYYFAAQLNIAIVSIAGDEEVDFKPDLDLAIAGIENAETRFADEPHTKLLHATALYRKAIAIDDILLYSNAMAYLKQAYRKSEQAELHRGLFGRRQYEGVPLPSPEYSMCRLYFLQGAIQFRLYGFALHDLFTGPRESNRHKILASDHLGKFLRLARNLPSDPVIDAYTKDATDFLGALRGDRTKVDIIPKGYKGN